MARACKPQVGPCRSAQPSRLAGALPPAVPREAAGRVAARPSPPPPPTASTCLLVRHPQHHLARVPAPQHVLHSRRRALHALRQATGRGEARPGRTRGWPGHVTRQLAAGRAAARELTRAPWASSVTTRSWRWAARAKTRLRQRRRLLRSCAATGDSGRSDRSRGGRPGGTLSHARGAQAAASRVPRRGVHGRAGRSRTLGQIWPITERPPESCTLRPSQKSSAALGTPSPPSAGPPCPGSPAAAPPPAWPGATWGYSEM
jgi:hypothetical protein